MDDYVRLENFPNHPQAELIAALLIGNRIPSLIRGTEGLSVPGAFDIGGVELWVPLEDLRRARQAIGLEEDRAS